MHIGKNFSSWWVINVMPFQLNRSTQFPVNAVQSLLFEEATNRVNCVALTPFRVKVNLCLNIFKMSKVKSEAFLPAAQRLSLILLFVGVVKSPIVFASTF